MIFLYKYPSGCIKRHIRNSSSELGSKSTTCPHYYRMYPFFFLLLFLFHSCFLFPFFSLFLATLPTAADIQDSKDNSPTVDEAFYPNSLSHLMGMFLIYMKLIVQFCTKKLYNFEEEKKKEGRTKEKRGWEEPPRVLPSTFGYIF